MKETELAEIWRWTYPQTIENDNSLPLTSAALHFLGGLQHVEPPVGLDAEGRSYARELLAVERLTGFPRGALTPDRIEIYSAGCSSEATPFLSLPDSYAWEMPSQGEGSSCRRKDIQETFAYAFNGLVGVHPVSLPMSADYLAGKLTPAVQLIEQAMGGLGTALLGQVRQVCFVGGSSPFMSGTALGAPRTIFLNPELLEDTPKLAEAILHESVHATLHKSYLERTPLRRFAAAQPEADQICAVWHNRKLSDTAQDAWWGPERSFQAFTVYVHVAFFYLNLLETGEHSRLARERLRTCLFRAHFLGTRLVNHLADCFAGRVQQFIRSLAEILPVTGDIVEAVSRHDGMGIRRVVQEQPSRLETLPGHDFSASGRFLYSTTTDDIHPEQLMAMTAETGFVFTGEWARALRSFTENIGEQSTSKSLQAAVTFMTDPDFAARPATSSTFALLDEMVAVDGIALTHMASSELPARVQFRLPIEEIAESEGFVVPVGA